MIAVDQTTFGYPEGNCFSACVASLLELELEQVPHFMGDDRWFARFLGWAREIGLWAIVLPADGTWQPLGYCILAGKSPRGDFAHAVVGWGMQVVHDPHPSRAGIETCTEVIVLVPMNPSVR